MLDHLIFDHYWRLGIYRGTGYLPVQDCAKISTQRHHAVEFSFSDLPAGNVSPAGGGTIGFFLLEFNNTMADLNFLEKLNCAFFQSTNTRTAGFASVNIGAQYEFTKILSIVLMFIGACPGSTGGGIKTTTFVVLVATVMCTIRGKSEAVVLRHRFTTSVVYKAFTVAIVAFLLVFVDAGVISALNPDISYLDCLYEAMSAFATVGLSPM